MTWLFRFALYVPILFLVMIVYVGQHETTARAILPKAVRKTIKFTLYTVLGVVIMLAIEWAFLP